MCISSQLKCQLRQLILRFHIKTRITLFCSCVRLSLPKKHLRCTHNYQMSSNTHCDRHVFLKM